MIAAGGCTCLAECGARRLPRDPPLPCTLSGPLRDPSSRPNTPMDVPLRSRSAICRSLQHPGIAVKASSLQHGWAKRCRCHGLSSAVTDKASRRVNAHDAAWHTAHWVSSNPRIPSRTLVRSRNTCRSRRQISEEGTAARHRLREAPAPPHRPVHSRHDCE